MFDQRARTWEEEAALMRAARERRIAAGLGALLAGKEDWWRALATNEFDHRLESGAVLARFVQKVREGLAP